MKAFYLITIPSSFSKSMITKKVKKKILKDKQNALLHSSYVQLGIHVYEIKYKFGLNENTLKILPTLMSTRILPQLMLCFFKCDFLQNLLVSYVKSNG